MSISHILDDSKFDTVQTVPLVVTTLRGGVLNNTINVPIGTVNYTIPSKCSAVVCLSGETLTVVNWTFPLVSACPGLQISLFNKSTTTTINLLTQGGNYLPSYLSPATIGPSGGPGNDQYYFFQSDGIDTWQ
jgi:hypothetical protein